ncbi:MAG: FG-GAP-like repeat-containing protein [Chitinophagales bacterium]
MKNLFLIFSFAHIGFSISAQPVFTKITDESNPVTEEGPLPGSSSAYVGCAWIDYDNDGLLDLFAVRTAVYHNEGGGNFSKAETSALNVTSGLGTSWADYNNDGFIDCFISGGNTRGSSLYKNNGDGTFSKNYNGDLNDSLALRGWASSFGDMNNDSYADIVIAAPFGFAAIDDGNKLLLNNGDEFFTKLDTSLIEQLTAPYTVATWSDYDFDGDLDCFIGSGPAVGTRLPDYLYKNEFIETGLTGYFTKITTSPIATDSLDGQVWNWIDYDNDGDLDAYLTNYWGGFPSGMPNNLYEHDGETFISKTADEVGSIVSDEAFSLASVWEDFDNDGDLDCFVTNDGPAKCFYYNNNGDGSFTKIDDLAFVEETGYFWGASAGDFDNDGDIDLYVMGTETNKALFRNDTENGYNWVNVLLNGTASNRSAIGARVRCKALLDGAAVWQMREVSAQNSFNSMNSLNVEFGLKNATVIDSIIIEWPSGQVDICTNVAVNKFYFINEGECNFTTLQENEFNSTKAGLKIFPNPAKNSLKIEFDAIKEMYISVSLVDSNGKVVHTELKERTDAGNYQKTISVKKLPAGIYNCILQSGEERFSAKFEVIK